MHVLATWELGRGYGHVGILASVSRVLRHLGHRSTAAARYPETVAATCGRDFDAVVPAPRFEGPVPCGETVTYAQVIAAGGLGDAETLRPLVARWLRLIERVRPDVVLSEHAPVSLLAARIAGVPARRIGSSFIAPAPDDLGSSLLPWRRAAVGDLAAVCDPAIVAVSGGAVCGLADLVAGAPRFATTWPELDHFASGKPLECFHGDLGGLPGDSRVLHWRPAPGPRVIVYMPPDRGPGPALQEALRRLGWPVLWHWPGAGGDGPRDTIRFAAEPIDLVAAAASARIFVGRAGHGASALMMRAGVAQLLVPDTLESLLLAYRMRCAGLATTCAGDVAASDYAHALERLASGSLDGALQAAARRYETYDPARAAHRIAKAIAGATR